MKEQNIFRKLVEESIVLLQNNGGILPLKKDCKVAFFGRAQLETFFSGNGSGASKAMENKNLLSECEKDGICAVSELKAFYQGQQGTEPEKFVTDGLDINKAGELTSGFMYEIFGRYQAPCEEYDVPDELMSIAGKQTDTAIFVLGRNSGGEECDRHLEADYYLTPSEEKMLGRMSSVFEKIIVILNINGLIDLSWLKRYPMIQGVLFMGIPGEEGCGAMADILVGKVNPSGKLSISIAGNYEDYPASEYFTWDKENPEHILTYESYGLNAAKNGSVGFEKSPVSFYHEDIYVGYRYFDSFDKDVLFPFGYGLSYSSFDMCPIQLLQCSDGVELVMEVTNTGDYAGKETVQVYLSCQDVASERPLQELKGFEKTKLLKPGESEEVHIWIPVRELACYVEEEAAYIIEKGTYRFLAGNSSRNTVLVGKIRIEEDLLMERCVNRLKIQGCNADQLHFLSKDMSCKEVKKYDREENKKRAEEIPIDQSGGAFKKDWEEAKVKELSDRELAALCVGYGPGTPFAAFGDGNEPETIYNECGRPLTTNSHPVGTKGYVSPAIEEKGIYSIFYKDGPAGVGTGAWPTEMLISCAFNKELWRRFGDAVGSACEEQRVDVWLAPAVNIHRHPLCGRNFEYFSEDPYLTGACACQIAKGVQESHKVCVCPKHFAANEQETYRRGSAKKNYDAVDSLLTERAAREIYLKPFEMLVRDTGISFLMTSFNKINGTFAGGNEDLCTHILREEWGFEGVVVTDWGDMDMVVNGGDAIAAGNDIVMPGGPPVIRQILKAYEEGKITRGDMERTTCRLLRAIAKCRGIQA